MKIQYWTGSLMRKLYVDNLNISPKYGYQNINFTLKIKKWSILKVDIDDFLNYLCTKNIHNHHPKFKSFCKMSRGFSTHLKKYLHPKNTSKCWFFIIVGNKNGLVWSFLKIPFSQHLFILSISYKCVTKWPDLNLITSSFSTHTNSIISAND